MSENNTSSVRKKAGTAAATKGRTTRKPAPGVLPADSPALDPRVDEATRLHMVREAAYFHSLNRSLATDTAQEDDWYRAEREIDALLGRPSS